LAAENGKPLELRVAMLQLLGELGEPSTLATLLSLVTNRGPEQIKLAALDAVQSIPNPDTDRLPALYPNLTGVVRTKAREVLLSRKAWARAFLGQIDSGKLPASEVSVEELRKVPLLQDPQLDDLVRKHWGNISPGTPEVKLADVRRFNNDLRAFDGDPGRGHEIFKKTCAVCHRLFDEGGAIGPDLTHANRKDRDYLLLNIVDPSAVIRKEFLSYNLETSDGRFLSGLIVEQTPDHVTLLSATNERTTVPQDKIKTLQESPISLMPENLLTGLKPQELRDLFSYLQK
jgi:putative heme-binding domain-containing protein